MTCQAGIPSLDGVPLRWAAPWENPQIMEVEEERGMVDAVWIETLSHKNGAHVRSKLNQTLVQGADNEEVEIQTLCFNDSRRVKLIGWNYREIRQEDSSVATVNILIK